MQPACRINSSDAISRYNRLLPAQGLRDNKVQENCSTVANIKSQIKRNRQNEKRQERNRRVRSELRTRRKAALAEAETGADSTEALELAIKRIDKAAAKGVLHKNTAARRKSRLIRQVNELRAK